MNYTIIIKNLQGNRWDVKCNDECSLGELKNKIKSKVIIKNNSYFDNNFPFCIIYSGVRITEQYEDNVKLKDLNIIRNSILYIIDIDNKKPNALTSSTYITELKENNKNVTNSIPYSDGMIPTRAPSLSPSFLDLNSKI